MMLEKYNGGFVRIFFDRIRVDANTRKFFMIKYFRAEKSWIKKFIRHLNTPAKQIADGKSCRVQYQKKILRLGILTRLLGGKNFRIPELGENFPRKYRWAAGSDVAWHSDGGENLFFCARWKHHKNLWKNPKNTRFPGGLKKGVFFQIPQKKSWNFTAEVWASFQHFPPIYTVISTAPGGRKLGENLPNQGSLPWQTPTVCAFASAAPKIIFVSASCSQKFRFVHEHD